MSARSQIQTTDDLECAYAYHSGALWHTRIERAIAAAIAEEREACAKEADDESRRCTGDRASCEAADRIADAIRARGVR